MFTLPAPVTKCLSVLRRNGFAAHPVGGCVRDLLLGRVPGDWDVTTSARPEQVMALFDRTVPTGLPHGTVTVLLDGQSFEVTTFRADVGYSDGRHPDAVVFGASLRDDLARRDFTVNAMALAEGGSVIDPFGGQNDLRRKLIRAVGDPTIRFHEDALRMFRAIRFSAQLDFSLEDDTRAALVALAHRARFLSGERIKVEVEKTLLSPRPELAAHFLQLGLLSAPLSPSPDVLRPAFQNIPRSQGARWRTFCEATGFDITTLPIERRLRAAVLHPEREAVKTLALKADRLMALGFDGPALGQVQTYLARHILAHPQDNTTEALSALAQSFHP